MAHAYCAFLEGRTGGGVCRVCRGDAGSISRGHKAAWRARGMDCERGSRYGEDTGVVWNGVYAGAVVVVDSI
jgi:hypothetical protein